MPAPVPAAHSKVASAGVAGSHPAVLVVAVETAREADVSARAAADGLSASTLTPSATTSWRRPPPKPEYSRCRRDPRPAPEYRPATGWADGTAILPPCSADDTPPRSRLEGPVRWPSGHGGSPHA